MIDLDVVNADTLAALRANELQARANLLLLLDAVGLQVIAYLRSLTNVMRPPVRSGEGPRPAHPGGWADVTSQLANSYGYEVNATAEATELVLFNTAEYAVHLENRDGYWVLSGVTDPGGPVVAAITTAAEAFGFEVIT